MSRLRKALILALLLITIGNAALYFFADSPFPRVTAYWMLELLGVAALGLMLWAITPEPHPRDLGAADAGDTHAGMNDSYGKAMNAPVRAQGTLTPSYDSRIHHPVVSDAAKVKRLHADIDRLTAREHPRDRGLARAEAEERLEKRLTEGKWPPGDAPIGSGRHSEVL